MSKLPKEVQTIIDAIVKQEPLDVSPSTKIKFGNLLAYVYDPKYKSVLPVWDQLPLVILLNLPDGKYILGINLHYIPWTYRLQLMKSLQQVGEARGVRIRYRDVVKAWRDAKVPMGYAKLAIRKYLISHIRSKVKIFRNAEDQYEIVKNILPIFHKKKAAQVYRDINMKLKQQRASKGKK